MGPISLGIWGLAGGPISLMIWPHVTREMGPGWGAFHYYIVQSQYRYIANLIVVARQL